MRPVGRQLGLIESERQQPGAAGVKQQRGQGQKTQNTPAASCRETEGAFLASKEPNQPLQMPSPKRASVGLLFPSSVVVSLPAFHVQPPIDQQLDLSGVRGTVSMQGLASMTQIGQIHDKSCMHASHVYSDRRAQRTLTLATERCLLISLFRSPRVNQTRERAKEASTDSRGKGVMHNNAPCLALDCDEIREVFSF